MNVNKLTIGELLLVLLACWLQCSRAIDTPKWSDSTMCDIADNYEVKPYECTHGYYKYCGNRYRCYVRAGDTCKKNNDETRCLPGLECICGICQNCDDTQNCVVSLCNSNELYKRWIKRFEKTFFKSV